MRNVSDTSDWGGVFSNARAVLQLRQKEDIDVAGKGEELHIFLLHVRFSPKG